MVGLIGKKLGMTRVFDDEGRSVPVTVLECGPCPVTQVKTLDTDGYSAVQIGYGADRKEKRTPKAIQGHLAKANSGPLRMLREFRTGSDEEFELGQELTVERFQEVGRVSVAGVTKGRGFAGGIRRHNMHRGPMTHGSHSKREIGSIGMCATPSRVLRGRKLPGRYGGARRTAKHLKVVRVDSENNLLFVRGAVPGAKNGFVLVKPA